MSTRTRVVGGLVGCAGSAGRLALVARTVRCAPELLDTIEACVREYVGSLPAGDDVTMLALTRVE